ncbi:hypothetical protein BDV38DRAFT_272462 [Aspergillus pseudotamarii]|uniref:ER-bound oxygenase mpaB/mpaB'/Rubber oxygenase catalytic domain-containing protein n=1 Tax=Aspergillus pseudotamarii TaxID=132259 RepID=A0A5N6SQ11_ASPPS|nr:uncharacterized protein BDV38DRAFT_272462 [Aspergillus pseudotamarii]KAE8135997.1 hypothetical protein BDV38DRAFT_272462 [Aspergillus pseudotamarii]
MVNLSITSARLLLTAAVLLPYILIVKRLRFQRARRIEAKFSGRPLSSMTVKEAHEIFRELRELEFPYTLHSAMKLSLLKIKTGSIPTMTKLFVATRQLNEKNASKRAADTEVVLNEVHDREPGSESHLMGIARMNYLHARYRKAGKILDEDMLHTLGSAVVDIVRGVDRNEWRRLTDVERCAIGVFHKALGDAMEIPFTFLPSYETGWKDGIHFAQELYDWTLAYEKVAAQPTDSTRYIGRRLMELAKCNMPAPLKPLIESIVVTKLEEHSRISMGFEKPGILVSIFAKSVLVARKFILRYLSLPRPDSKAVHVLSDSPDPSTGLYTWNLWIEHPWYIKPTFKHRWGPKALLVRLFGNGAIPSETDSYKESGYDLRTIGPVAQEKRGQDEMEAIFQSLKGTNYAAACPFHA